MTQVYLVTGANRGIGFGLVEKLAKRNDVVVYATARDVAKASKLQALADSHSSVRILKLDVSVESDHADVASIIEKEQGYLDVVFANAGTAINPGTILATPLQSYRDNFEVNTIGLVANFLALYKLLEKSVRPNGPIFLALSTILASTGEGLDFAHTSGYEVSKAATNHIIKRLSIEKPDIIFLAVHPGLVDTDMGGRFATSLGQEISALGGISVDTSTDGLLSVADAATKEYSGTFRDYANTIIGW